MYKWQNTGGINGVQFKCGYCNSDAAPSQMFYTDDRPFRGRIYICPKCTKPTFLDQQNDQTPKTRMGNDVGGISDEGVSTLFKEARDCTSVGSYTAAVMVCRKILMNLAVHNGAKENESFATYVTFLADKGYVPPQGKPWVDAIRKRGNDANHEIAVMNEKDAHLILRFTEALLRFNYELPSELEAGSS